MKDDPSKRERELLSNCVVQRGCDSMVDRLNAVQELMRWFLGFHIMQLRCSAPNSETDRRRRERRYGRKEDAEFDGSPQQICAQSRSSTGRFPRHLQPTLRMSPWRWLEFPRAGPRASTEQVGVMGSVM